MDEEKENLEMTQIEGIKNKYLTFLTESQSFAIPISYVVQIVGMQEITEIPEFPHYAKGIINLRGEIIPVIDIRLRLGRMEREYDERTCIIVINMSDHIVGLIVDEVDEVTEISRDVITPPPQIASSGGSYITGVAKLNKRVVLLMDAGKLLGEEELAWFNQYES